MATRLVMHTIDPRLPTTLFSKSLPGLPERQAVTGRSQPVLGDSLGAMTHPESGRTALRFGNGGGVMELLRRFMAFLDADKIMELVVSDLGAMVLPRTAIEGVKRGVDAGRETFFREITGTITNTFLAGWMGYLAVSLFKSQRANPLGMDLKGWIDASTLDAFGKISREVLDNAKGKTGVEIQESFLKTALSRLKSTDNIPNLKAYQQYFPGKGKLEPQHVQTMIDRYMGRTPGYPYHAMNVEEMVVNRMKLPQYQEEIREAVESAEKQFMEKWGEKPVTPAAQKRLDLIKSRAKQKALSTQKHALRGKITHDIRNNEQRFLKSLYNYAIKQGKLSEEVFLLDAKGKPIGSVGSRTVPEMLKKIKYFMEEFLNRSLANPVTGEVPKTAIDSAVVKQRLFNVAGKTWTQQKLIPNIKDGLVTYAMKSKHATVLAPILVTLTVGCSMVLINNWMTRRKYGGENFFPGERALMEGGKGRFV